MTPAQLRAVMKFHLKHFDDEGVPINDDTIHHDVLSDSDGFGAASSMRLYKGSIRWTLWNAGDKDPAWPSSWMDMSVHELAAALIPES